MSTRLEGTSLTFQTLNRHCDHQPLSTEVHRAPSASDSGLCTLHLGPDHVVTSSTWLAQRKHCIVDGGLHLSRHSAQRAVPRVSKQMRVQIACAQPSIARQSMDGRFPPQRGSHFSTSRGMRKQGSKALTGVLPYDCSTLWQACANNPCCTGLQQGIMGRCVSSHIKGT